MIRRCLPWGLLWLLWLVTSNCSSEQEPCNEGTSSSAYPVEGCCDPGARKSASGRQANTTDECDCPGTGETLEGTAICNAAGNAFDCTQCPPVFAAGGACQTEGQINCPFVLPDDAARNGHADGMPVLHCVGGSWKQIFVCTADFCSSNSGASGFSVKCGLDMGVEGAPCSTGGTGYVCDFAQTKVMGCVNGQWNEAELCTGNQKCRAGLGSGAICR